MILQKMDEGCRGKAASRRAAALALVPVHLTLKQISIQNGRAPLVDASGVILVVGLGESGQPDPSRVVEIVIERGIQSVPTFLDRSQESDVLRLVLGKQNNAAFGGCLSR